MGIDGGKDGGEREDTPMGGKLHSVSRSGGGVSER